MENERALFDQGTMAFPPDKGPFLQDRPYGSEVYSPSQLFDFLWSRIDTTPAEEGKLMGLLSNPENTEVRNAIIGIMKLDQAGRPSDTQLNDFRRKYLE